MFNEEIFKFNIDNIKNASYEDLLEVKGITREVAHNIVELFAADL